MTRRRAVTRGALAGVAVAVTAVAGGAAVLREAGASLGGVAVVATALFASLVVGIWAGAPAASRGAAPARERWVSAAIAFALAGAVATMWQIYAATVVTGFGRVLAMLALIASPAYALGLLLPSLLAETALEMGDEDDGPGWAPIGAVVVGALGGFAIAIPAVAILLLPWLAGPPIFLATALALLLPLLQRETQAGPAVETVLSEVHTPTATLRVTEVAFPGERQPERRLYLDEEQESGELVRSGAPTLGYVAAAESWLTRDGRRGGRYLFLGGGAYTLPRRIAERDPAASITVVEIDAEITRLAYRFFGLRPDHAIATVTGDARAYLEQSGETFDRVYLDVYSGSESIPHHLVTAEAFASLRARLAPGAAIGMNLIGIAAGPESVRMWSVVRTLAETFPAVALYTHLGPDFPELQNLMLLAATDEGHRFPDSVGVMERWPAERWDPPATAAVLRDLYPTSAARAGAAPSASRPGSAG